MKYQKYIGIFVIILIIITLVYLYFFRNKHKRIEGFQIQSPNLPVCSM